MKFTALIIDDEPDICEILSHILDETNLFKRIVLANDGVTACSKMSNQKFDVIFLDVNLPKRKGFEVAKNINENNIEDIIVISGDLDRAALSLLMKVGIKHYLIKPFDNEALIKKLGLVLKGKK